MENGQPADIGHGGFIVPDAVGKDIDADDQEKLHALQECADAFQDMGGGVFGAGAGGGPDLIGEKIAQVLQKDKIAGTDRRAADTGGALHGDKIQPRLRAVSGAHGAVTPDSFRRLRAGGLHGGQVDGAAAGGPGGLGQKRLLRPGGFAAAAAAVSQDETAAHRG